MHIAILSYNLVQYKCNANLNTHAEKKWAQWHLARVSRIHIFVFSLLQRLQYKISDSCRTTKQFLSNDTSEQKNTLFIIFFFLFLETCSRNRPILASAGCEGHSVLVLSKPLLRLSFFFPFSLYFHSHSTHGLKRKWFLPLGLAAFRLPCVEQAWFVYGCIISKMGKLPSILMQSTIMQ